MRYRRGVLLAIVVLLAAACAADEPAATGGEADPTVAAAPTDTATQATDDDEGADGATVTLSASDLGEILADGDDATLYLFLNDEQGASTCYDDCEQNWPPLPGPAQAGDGVDDSLLGTVERDDGTMQVTYNDWPLYYFAGDAAPGDTAGQGVGDVWFAVDADGEPIKDGTATSGQY